MLDQTLGNIAIKREKLNVKGELGPWVSVDKCQCSAIYGHIDEVTIVDYGAGAVTKIGDLCKPKTLT